MYKLAILCGALVLSSANLFAQSSGRGSSSDSPYSHSESHSSRSESHSSASRSSQSASRSHSSLSSHGSESSHGLTRSSDHNRSSDNGWLGETIFQSHRPSAGASRPEGSSRSFGGSRADNPEFSSYGGHSSLAAGGGLQIGQGQEGRGGRDGGGRDSGSRGDFSRGGDRVAFDVHEHRGADPIRRAPGRLVDVPSGYRDRHDWGHDGLYLSFGDDFFRFGYVYCNDYYRHPHWWYPGYYYEPSALVVVSPFYYYPELPPYLSVDAVTYGGIVFADPTVFTTYDYSYPGQGGFGRQWDDDPYGSAGRGSNSYDEYRYADRTKFDHALDNMVDAFANGDAGYVRGLIPTSGSVAIAQDGLVRYSISGSDFGNLYRDLIETTRSRAYEITSVHVYNDNSSRVIAKHTRIDAYGNRTTVTHEYRLAYEGHHFVIRKFGVSYGGF